MMASQDSPQAPEKAMLDVETGKGHDYQLSSPNTISPVTTLRGSSIECQKAPAEDSDGGFWGWSTVMGAFLLQAIGFGYANAYGVYQDYYVRVYLPENTASQISWIGSVQLLLIMSIGLVSGRLFDWGYFYHLVVGGCILSVFSLFMLSLTKPHQFYAVFITQGVLFGLGIGLTYIPSIAIVAHHFTRRRALAMGIVATGSSFGGVLHPIMLNFLFHGKVGFANGVRASACVLAFLCILSIALMRTNPPKRNVERTPLWTAFRSFLKDGPYVFVVLGLILFYNGFMFPFVYIQLDAVDHGLNADFAFYTVTILNGASVIGRLGGGWLAAPWGVMNLFVFVTTSCGILIFAMFGNHDIPSFSIVTALYGIVSGVYVTLLGPLFAALSNDVTEIGARMGIAFTFAGFGALIGSPINGALLAGKTGYVWYRPLVFSGVTCLAGASMFVVARTLLVKRKGAQIL